MKTQDLEDHLAKLRAESEEIKKERGDFSKRLGKAGTVADLDKLSIEESQIKIHEDEIALKTRQAQTLLTQLKTSEETEGKRKRAEKVDGDLQHAEHTKYLCPQCDGILKYQGPRHNSGLGISGSTWKQGDPPLAYVIRLDCPSCNTYFLRSVAELGQLEKVSQRAAKPRKVMQGSPSGSFNVVS